MSDRVLQSRFKANMLSFGRQRFSHQNEDLGIIDTDYNLITKGVTNPASKTLGPK